MRHTRGGQETTLGVRKSVHYLREGSLRPPASQAGITGTWHHSKHFHECARSQLKALCSQGKHFTSWTFPQLILYSLISDTFFHISYTQDLYHLKLMVKIENSASYYCFKYFLWSHKSSLGEPTAQTQIKSLEIIAPWCSVLSVCSPYWLCQPLYTQVYWSFVLQCLNLLKIHSSISAISRILIWVHAYTRSLP